MRHPFVRQMQKTKDLSGLWFLVLFTLVLTPALKTFAQPLSRPVAFARNTISVALAPSAKAMPMMTEALLVARDEFASLPCAIQVRLIDDVKEADVVIFLVDAEAWSASKTFAANTQKKTRGRQIKSAEVMLNARYNFEIESPFINPDAVFLPALMMHELGHALGLKHSRSPLALMRAGVPQEASFGFDDIVRICHLY